MGIRTVLPLNFTNNSLPKNRADSLITDGSLMLIDFGRESTAPRASAPAHGASLKNLAWNTAAAVIGAGDETTLAATFEDTLVGQPAMGLIERSSKYGIHVIASQSANDTASRHGGISIPSQILGHIRANLPSHSIYVSIWGRLTRIATASADAIGYIGDVVNGNNCAVSFYKQPARAPADGSTALVGAMATPATNTTGNFFRAICADEWTATKPTLGNTIGKFWFGQQGVYAGFQRNGAASGIWYRFYIEDLTVSGRSYADTVAADKALFDAAFAPGGRFADDTFTAPSTIP
jgi:hypothetical protein